MTKPDPAILRASRLRALISMPEYKDTVGLWIQQSNDDALHRMTSAKEPHDFYAAQGAYKQIKALIEQFQSVFDREAAALDKQQRKTKGE
jgi:hypothetical protein